MSANKFSAIIGLSADPVFAGRIHDLLHTGKVEYLRINGTDLARKRLRAVTNKGTECAIALPRHVALEHGAILELSSERAIVIELEELPWLCFETQDQAAALKLGFFAGHHHWRVRFEDTRMLVALEAPAETYTSRLVDMLESGRVRLVHEDE